MQLGRRRGRGSFSLLYDRGAFRWAKRVRKDPLEMLVTTDSIQATAAQAEVKMSAGYQFFWRNNQPDQ